MYKAAAVLLVIFAIIFALGGCNNDKTDIQSEYYLLIGKPADVDNITILSEFLDDNIEKVDEAAASRMVDEYREYLFGYITQNKDKTIIQELDVYLSDETGLIDTDMIQNSEHKSYYDSIKAGSLMIKVYEDSPVLKIDHSKLLEKYGEYISESLNELFEFEAELLENPTTENASLIISWEELLARTHEAEMLIGKYPDDERLIKDAFWIYKTHLNVVLMGATNTPVFDYTSKEFSKEAKEAYKEYILSDNDTVIKWVLQEFSAYLNSIDYYMDFNSCQESKVFFDTCDWLVSEAEKRVKNGSNY